MGYLDKIKDKASELARTKGGKFGDTVDKAADAINRKTDGKHADKVSKFSEQAKRKVDELAEDDSQRPEGGDPASPPS